MILHHNQSKEEEEEEKKMEIDSYDREHLKDLNRLYRSFQFKERRKVNINDYCETADYAKSCQFDYKRSYRYRRLTTIFHRWHRDINCLVHPSHLERQQ